MKRLLGVVMCWGLLVSCEKPQTPIQPQSIPIHRTVAVTDTTLLRLVESGVRQAGVTTSYDATYRAIPYPNGDVPIETGVCSDVVIRAFRRIGMDFQQLVYEDMRKNFGAYPNLWNLKAPDRNIDHRRVPNLERWFERHGWLLPVTREAADYQPGDLVTWRIPPNLAHIGLVTHVLTPSNRLAVVHNYGRGALVQDALFVWPVTGHFRMPRP